MKRIRTAATLAEIGLYKGILDAADIACVVRNQTMSQMAGSVPYGDVLPELWVAHERDWERAESALTAAVPDAADDAPWVCPACGEEVEGNFAACWACGADRPGPER